MRGILRIIVLVALLLVTSSPATNCWGTPARYSLRAPHASELLGSTEALWARAVVVQLASSCTQYPLTLAVDGEAGGGVPPYKFSWSFGDGTPVDPTENATHAYNSTGQFNVSLHVMDSTLDSAWANFSVLSQDIPCDAPASYGPPLIIGGLVVCLVLVTISSIIIIRRHRRIGSSTP